MQTHCPHSFGSFVWGYLRSAAILTISLESETPDSCMLLAWTSQFHEAHQDSRFALGVYIATWSLRDLQVRAPMPPMFFFVIDVSVNAINSGMVGVACAAIRSCLDNLPGEGRTRIGFLAYDDHLHFIKLKPRTDEPVYNQQNQPFIEVHPPHPLPRQMGKHCKFS